MLTTFVSRIVASSEQTTGFGRLHGAIMLGTAVAHLCRCQSNYTDMSRVCDANPSDGLAGGTVSDMLGISAAFEVGTVLMAVSIIYAAIFLPKLPMMPVPPSEVSKTVWHDIITPFQAILVTKIVGSDRRSYQRPLLAISVFTGVVSTDRETIHRGTPSRANFLFSSSLLPGLSRSSYRCTQLTALASTLNRCDPTAGGRTGQDCY